MITPAEVIQRQLDAYNNRDIEAFMTNFTEDSEFYLHPSTLLAKGLDGIRARHVERFKESNLHGALLHRIVVGNSVVNQERVTRTFPEGTGEVDAIAIYEVAGNKIAKAWFVLGKPVLNKIG